MRLVSNYSERFELFRPGLAFFSFFSFFSRRAIKVADLVIFYCSSKCSTLSNPNSSLRSKLKKGNPGRNNSKLSEYFETSLICVALIWDKEVAREKKKIFKKSKIKINHFFVCQLFFFRSYFYISYLSYDDETGLNIFRKLWLKQKIAVTFLKIPIFSGEQGMLPI